MEIFLHNGKATVVGNTKSIDYDLDLPGNTDIAIFDLLADPQELVNLTPPPGC